MVQIKCLSNGLYSLKNSHIPFGMGFQPPRPYGGFPFEQHFSYKGASLTPTKNHQDVWRLKCFWGLFKNVQKGKTLFRKVQNAHKCSKMQKS